MDAFWKQVLEADTRLFLWLNQGLAGLDIPFLRALLRFANQFGAEMMVGVLVIAVVVLTHGHRERIRRLLDLGFSMGLVAVFVQLYKAGFPRHRPQRDFKDAMDQIHVAFNEIASRHSFPSGHTAMAFGIATLLTIWAFGSGERWKGWTVLVSSYLLASLCGLARVYTAVHYPLDVIAGASAGIAGPLLVHAATGLWRRARGGRRPSAGPLAPEGAPPA
jgi:undecaprenyl-diphosphatase